MNDIKDLARDILDMGKSLDQAKGALEYHRKRTKRLMEFIRKYAYHSTNCRYPQLTCNCGYSRARARCDV